MSDFSIRKYTTADADLWNSLAASARNATFLFDRGYMDYHADRFADCSLIAERRGRPVALLPADITSDGTLHSHRGLTYGGWILPRRHFDATDMLRMFDDMSQWCRAEGIHAIDYKPLPSIYATAPSDEDLYALWRHGAVCTECNISAAVDITANPGLDAIQRSKYNRCSRMGVKVVELADEASIGMFHDMLSTCLARRHDAAPVHSLDELLMLRRRFPQHIRLFATQLDGVIHAGICVYDLASVRHCQYTATTEQGRKLNLLTPLTAHLIATMLPGQRYMDFGTSNEQAGRVLNEGLYSYKASYGATGVIHRRYRLDI
ncbi:MAG: GNAT family N-acetyltransferase [Muribaculaceae bacterium]|nr:GNAT family N-acetyltransferase [Muribaculaceae bacterium]